MKQLFISCFVFTFCTINFACKAQETSTNTENVFIITIDGVRWQEVFNGADSFIIKNPTFVSNQELITQLFWSDDLQERRKKLMPFMWSVIAQNGTIMGNRNFENKMNAANFYKISYPGYNEIFTGYADWKPILNTPTNNTNINILEYFNALERFKNKVVAFSSWNIFPFILNEKRNNILVNSGYENVKNDSYTNQNINKVQDDINDKAPTRLDMLTFVAAKEYIQKNHPKIISLGFGETDEYAHQKKYDFYLQQINQLDKLIGELWYYIQTDNFYKNNSTIIITTDHGRGTKPTTWDKHHLLVKGSGETWMAMLGKNVANNGELKKQEQIYLTQIASTIAQFLGETFVSNHKIGTAIQNLIPQKTMYQNSAINTVLAQSK